MKHLAFFLNIILVSTAVIGSSHGAGKVVTVDSFDWSFQTSQQESSSSSSLTVKVMANISRRCDSVSGKNLWKVGVFGSEREDGSGERYGHVEQILNRKQACKSVSKGSVFRLKNLRTRFDLNGVSCGNASFLCVELARNRDSSVSFELRYGNSVDSVIACKTSECSLSGIAAERNDLPPICSNFPCPPEEAASGVVCGNNSVEYDNLCELQKAAQCEGIPVGLGNVGKCAIKKILVHATFWRYLLGYNPDNSSQPFLLNDLYVFAGGDYKLAGNDLWQVSFFRSANFRGRGIRENYQHQVLTRDVSSQSISDGSLEFPVHYNSYATGCEESPYLCYEFKRNPNCSVNFVVKKSRGGANSVLECRRMACSQIHYTVQLSFLVVRSSIVVKKFRSGKPSVLSIHLSLDVHPNSNKIVGGRNLWRLGIYGSRNFEGNETEKLGYIPQVLDSNDVNYSRDIIPGQRTVFPLVTVKFDISDIGCGDYRYICIELERDANSEPDFMVRNCGDKKEIVSCQRVTCRDRSRY